MKDPLVLDSVTQLTADARGRVAYCASHGSEYSALYAAEKGLSAVILSDAGVGRDCAGIAGIARLDEMGMAAAAISHRSARIGDGLDGIGRGVISYVNDCATSVGVRPGMQAAEALARLAAAELKPVRVPPGIAEARHELNDPAFGNVRVFTVDSIALLEPRDFGAIVLTGSHGGLLGGEVGAARRHEVFAAVYNDADRGIDLAGISRLPMLDEVRIAAACVSVWTARIGDGLSTYRDGIISAINATATDYGGELGQSAQEFVLRMVEARARGRR